MNQALNIDPHPHRGCPVSTRGTSLRGQQVRAIFWRRRLRGYGWGTRPRPSVPAFLRAPPMLPCRAAAPLGPCPVGRAKDGIFVIQRPFRETSLFGPRHLFLKHRCLTTFFLKHHFRHDVPRMKHRAFFYEWTVVSVIAAMVSRRRHRWRRCRRCSCSLHRRVSCFASQSSSSSSPSRSRSLRRWRSRVPSLGLACLSVFQ